MPDFRLPRSGDAPLKITAELVAESDGRRQGGKEHNRWHELAIYRLEDGRHAVQIAYRTMWQGELGHDHAELVLAAHDVPGVFRRYDPAAHVRGFPPGDAYTDRQRALLADVRQRYEAQVGELLDRDEFAQGDGHEALRQRRDLARYKRLLSESVAGLSFTRGEACLMCDANNGIGSFDLLGEPGEQTEWRWWLANVEDDIRLNGADQKWNVDAAALVAKVRALTPLELCAVADAMERFWATPERDTDQMLRDLGLVRDA